MTSLARLLAAVEMQGQIGVRTLAVITWRETSSNIDMLLRAVFSNDVNAAISLCGAMLPDYAWGRQWSGYMWVEPKEGGQRYYSPDGMTDPARALTIALLRALVAKEGV